MTVYVDDMRARFGRVVMCHMIADTDEQLHAMADRIGVARKWHQRAGTVYSHYDIALSKRALAVQAGAVEVTQREAGRIINAKRKAQHDSREEGYGAAQGKRRGRPDAGQHPDRVAPRGRRDAAGGKVDHPPPRLAVHPR